MPVADSPGVLAASAPLTAADLGFAARLPAAGEESRAWDKLVEGRPTVFRLVRGLAALAAVEVLQRAVFGVEERDLAAASALVTVVETGGDVLGAYRAGADGNEELVGFAVGWGGWVERRPRLVSDMLAVRADARGEGLGAELKTLQAVLALARGFVEMVWTVDPLRAANARLNFEKLGAYADRYEIDRYGPGYGAGLYGGLATDRLHVTWPLTSPRIRAKLLGRLPPLTLAAVAALPFLAPEATPPRALIAVPHDVDALLAADPAAVRRWRLMLRATLTDAFARGYAITGFVPDIDPARGRSAFVVVRPRPSDVEDGR